MFLGGRRVRMELLSEQPGDPVRVGFGAAMSATCGIEVRKLIKVEES